MTKQRSPRYPAIGLRDAVDKIEKIFNEKHRSAMTSEIAAQHLGYAGLTGASLPVISALRKYGFLEGRGDKIRVSNNAVTIIADRDAKDQSERIEALKKSLTNDDLFSDLFQQFGEHVSEKNITATLIKNGFTRDAATKASRSYLESIAFVNEASEGYNHPSEIQNIEETHEDESSHPPLKSLFIPPSVIPKRNMQQDTFNLDEGEVTLHWPARLSRDSYDELESWLNLLLRRAKRRAQNEEIVANGSIDNGIEPED